MIQINSLTKRFQDLVALDGITMKIKEGEVIGLLGPNGAGKTTLFKLIAGFLFPEEGRIETLQPKWPSIGYKPERLLFPNNLRVRSYLELAAKLNNISRTSIDEIVHSSLAKVNLLEAENKKISDCSKGMRQRLGLAQAIIGDPQLLLLDEPSNGLDPEGQAEICRHIEELSAGGKTIVLASHQLQEVTQVCTYLVILNRGKIHYENKMSDALAERPHATIHVIQDLSPLKLLLSRLHPDIEIEDTKVILNNHALAMRRKVMTLLLNAGYDITSVEQKRVTLAEIYAQAVQ